MFVQLSDDADLDEVQADLARLGLWTQTLVRAAGLAARRRGNGAPPAQVVRVLDHSKRLPPRDVLAIEGVECVWLAPSAHPLVDAQAGATVRVGPIRLGHGLPPLLMAGPCAVESPELIDQAAELASTVGASLLRGGAFKPRTSPRSFRGHGLDALRWLRDAADRHWLGVVTEVMHEWAVGPVAEVADLIQIGARNMQNYALLEAVGGAGKAVLLKRGLAASIDDWLMSAEHVLLAGATAVVFCERGLAMGEGRTRNLMDVTAVALLAEVLEQPIVVDPSHAAGRRDLVLPLSRAALAAGAHGLLVEAHPDAGRARSDAAQALTPDELRTVGRLFGSDAAPNGATSPRDPYATHAWVSERARPHE